jgi:putative Holliday junction resolvase
VKRTREPDGRQTTNIHPQQIENRQHRIKLDVLTMARSRQNDDHQSRVSSLNIPIQSLDLQDKCLAFPFHQIIIKSSRWSFPSLFFALTLALGLVDSNAWVSPQASFHKHNVHGLKCRDCIRSWALPGMGSLEDQIADMSKPSSIPRPSAPSLIDAASAVTQGSCRLLGVKSIGVDYGLVRTGLASTVGYNPSPIGILTDLNNTQVSQSVIRYARAEQASRIIVGLPLHKNGTVAEQTNITIVFGEELARNVLEQLGPNVPVLWWDERYTSKEAAARAHSRNPHSSLYGTLDADAACIILENYYEDNGEDAQEVELAPEVREQCILRWKVGKQSIDDALRASQDKRNSNVLRRKEAIAQERAMEKEMAENGTDDDSSPKKKKKKKKRR